jgi:hypothetical protein
MGVLRDLVNFLLYWQEGDDWSRDYYRRHGRWPEEDEERRKREEKDRSRAEQAWDRRGPQVVGEPCAECEKKIVFQDEGTICGVCNRPVHHQCFSHHTDGDEPKGPYR